MNKKWKILFFILLGLNIGFVIMIFALINSPNTDTGRQINEEEEFEDVVEFLIQTNKNDLNEIINHYILQQSEESAIDYKVILEDEVELYGTIQVFTQDIELKLTFEPEALENGDLLLRQESISIGNLRLPVEYVLKFVRDHYALPEWVNIMPEEKNVYIALRKMPLKGNFQVQVKRFDLRNDDIMFALMVPTK